MNAFDLIGRTALVTGSSHGIGRGITDALMASGVRVVWHGLEPVADLPPGATAFWCDLCQPAAPESLMQQAFDAAPELDTLVCNAGGFFDKPFLEMTGDRWDQTIALNVRAPYFLIQEFARRLAAAKRGGSVVVISSTNGFQPEDNSTAYDISKAALVMLTRTLALALAESGIRVNGVAPGLIRTPLTARWLDSNAEKRAHYEKNTPLGRIGEPGDCAGAVLFLVSDAAAYITGEVIIVDGGLSLRQVGKQ